MRDSRHSEARERFGAALGLHRKVDRECGQHASGDRYFATALALFRQVHDQVGEAKCLLGGGQIVGALDRTDAGSLLRQAFSLFDVIHQLEGRGKAMLELAELTESAEAKRELLLDALDSHSRFGNPYWIGETHHRLARLSESDEHHRHITAARDAWTSIERPDRFAELDAELDGN